MIKHKIPHLVEELIEATSFKINIELKRLAEKDLNLKLNLEKVQKDL
jgi:hypothetical protein